MSELDIVRLLNDKVVDFGNERFLEGWNGATEHIIKLLEDDQTNCFCDDCYTNRATEVPFEVKHNEYLIALIKGEK